jgi:hypothetical protein
MFLICLFFSIQSATPLTETHCAIGIGVLVCAQFGIEPDEVAKIFGYPDSSAEGRLDWRDNPDRYILWQFDRYGVWLEWSAGRIPRSGIGKRIKVRGSVLPR